MKKHKALRLFMIIHVIGIQITFMTMIFRENYDTNNYAALLALFLITLLLFGHKYVDLHHSEYAYEKIAVVVWIPIGAVITYTLNNIVGLGSVLSAGIVGTTASFIPKIKKQSRYLKKLPPALYCGAFIGMSSSEITPSIYFVIAAGMVAGLFYMFSKNLFLGVGGKLGTIAFAGVVTVSLIYWLSL
ncbi:hypothetical protein [Cellulophaga baltica]|jgi:uncharacterized protein (DUF983 family)|uniref:hypothetical protein n=1 Tax=Cellulophaga baltica TaxID=76594 RepID=UPI0021488A6D|nr:hypothetical protein [Cellulophaga baltica]MCR1026947.1 hypothetical protein [Cellulophaga baltica]